MHECFVGYLLTKKSDNLTGSIIGLYTKKAINVFSILRVILQRKGLV